MFNFLKKSRSSNNNKALAAKSSVSNRHTNSLAWHHMSKLIAQYDAAATTSNNQRHWANTDSLSADAAASPETRQILRERSRYEIANNSYANGIVLTLANDTVGTGPRLQMLTEDSKANQRIEEEFRRWSKAVRLSDKLRTMRMARGGDGEAFAMIVNNPQVSSSIKLDLKLVEADQVATPDLTTINDPNAVDGIIFDKYGNPKEYHILKSHPGSQAAFSSMEYDKVSASEIIHYFRVDRPGQSRGIPEITPALPLFAQLRRFTLAVIDAAETAATFTGVLQSDAPADDSDADVSAPEPMDLFELERRMLLTLPDGWKMGQVKAEQPTTTYGEFKHEILNEIARCLNMPFNIASCNSSKYNYASGRLDHQTYFKSIKVDQDQICSVVLDQLLKRWLSEAVLVTGLLPLWMRSKNFWELRHQWFWDGREHADPTKEAKAQETRLKNNTTTLASEYAKQGLDWEAEIEQRAKEHKKLIELGLTNISPVTPDRNKDEKAA